MNVKVTYTAIIIASALGMLGIKQWLDNVSLRTQLTILQNTADSCQERKKESAAVLKGMRTIFNGQTSSKIEQP